MKLINFLKDAKFSITIIGTNSLIPELEQSARLLADLLILNKEMVITILCESDNENFNQSLISDNFLSQQRLTFSSLTTHRSRVLGTGRKDGLIEEIRDLLKYDTLLENIINRISIRQLNLRLPVNLIEIDRKLWCCIITNSLTNINSYFSIEENEKLKKELLGLIDFYINPQKGGIYLSHPKEELIQLYDNRGYPRGIFPRECSYSTDFSYYAIWGFIFNRKGELLLHQRSKNAQDNRELWDKSIGGHVDLLDSSTTLTAQRELVEEMFLPQAEYTKFLRADLGDIINFGEWNPFKRPERTFREAFAGLSESDWVMFRAVDLYGEPLTIERVSDRRIHNLNGKISLKRVRMKCDIYLFIAPPGYLDDMEQMKKILSHAEESGAAKDHRLITIPELNSWIEEEEANGTDRETFTDDLLFISIQFRELIGGFSEFLEFVFGDYN